jgi:hypothetical protein
MTDSLKMAGDDIDIFIPIALSTNNSGLDNTIEGVIELYQKGGFDKFMLTGPSKGWRSTGYPPQEHFKEIASDILYFKEKVKDYDIKLGWWNTLTLKTGPAEYQRIVNIEGIACSTSTCPLDPGYIKRFSEDVALIAETAEPVMIIFEDDFGLNCHNGRGCFCDLHLQKFAEQAGRFYTREELKTILLDPSKETASLRKVWADVTRNSLANIASEARQAVDKVTPWMPMGSMQPGCSDADGNSTEAVARAFAGDKHRPFVRLHGTSYSGDNLFNLPQMTSHALYGKQHLPEDFICYHESDTYPHNRFFMSAAMMRSLMGTAYSYGFDGSTFQAAQVLDNPAEEVGYHEMFMKERKRFRTIKNLARKCEVSGLGLLSAPSHTNHWVSAAAHFGIPYTTLESPVNALSGPLPDTLSDEEIRGLLKKGLLLDGESAEILCKRGFSEEIGIKVTGKATIHDPGRDLEGREKIRDEFLRSGNDGRLMTWYSTYSPTGNGELYNLTLNSSDTEVVTDLLDYTDKIVGIGMTRFCNSLGGKVVVMGMSVKDNMSSSLFNYRRGRIIQDMLVWAGMDNAVYVKERPKTFCILNSPEEAGTDNTAGLVTLINLCADTFDSTELCIPKEWHGSTTVMVLDADGKWQEAAYEFTDSAVRIDISLQFCKPLFLKFLLK